MLDAARLQDIAPVFNLIQQGSATRHFNPAYLQPRYQAGLGLQLFSALWLKRLRYADTRWYPVRFRVLRHSGQFAGFVMLRQLDPQGTRHAIDFCSVLPDRQRQGWGAWMLQQVLSQLAAGTRVEASCLPASDSMARLLLRLGFVPETKAPDERAAGSAQTYSGVLPLNTSQA